jgi:uncharacterized protein (DUF1800 family)
MLKEMSVDPAMMVWLDTTESTKGKPNENYAREFFELFTLGVQPQVYTETDIREAAKAFTGWTANTITRLGEFVPARHDTTVKTVLGRAIGGHLTGTPAEAVEYQEVTEAALAHDGGLTASRFVAYKLVQQFGYAPDANLASDPLVSDVASALRASNWSIKSAVRTMLLHDAWRYAQNGAGYDLVRSPLETLIHAAKVLNFVSPNPYGSLYWPQAVLPYTDRAGQTPLVPPNVGGWPSGLNWLSQTTVLGRYDLLYVLVQYFHNGGFHAISPLPASGDLAAWAAYMGLDGFSTGTTLRLQEYLADPGTTDEVQKQIGMFVLVGTSPDWQVM